MRHLRRRPERQLVHEGLREARARLDRVRDQPVLAEAATDGRGRLGEQLVHLAGVELPGVAAVRAELVVDQRGTLGEGGLRIDHRVERLVVDGDELGRVRGERGAVCDDDRNRLADEPHAVAGEHRNRHVGNLGAFGGVDREAARAALHVAPRQDETDAVARRRGRDVDLVHARVRERTPHERGVQRVWQT